MKKLLKSLFCLLMVFGLVAVVTACKETEPTESAEKTVDVLSKFADDGSGTYTLTRGTTADGDATLAVAADKTNVAADKVANAALVADFTGTDLSTMNRLAFTIGGTCHIIMEIASGDKSVEIELALTTKEAGFQWDLSGTEEQAILDAGNVKVSIYAMKGKAEGVATLSLSYVTFSEKPAVYNKVVSGYTNIDPAFNNYDGTSSTFDVNNKWAEHDLNTYVATKQEDGSVKVDYNITGWNYMLSPVKGAIGKFDYLTIKLTGAKGEGFTLKTEDENNVPIGPEAQHKCNGELQIVSINLTGVDVARREDIRRVVFFATATGNASKNSIVIHECYFGTEDETDLGIIEGERLQYVDVNENGINITHDFNLNGNKNAFWTDAYKTDTKDLVYSVTGVNGNESPWKVTWDKAANQNEVPLILNVGGNFGNFSKLQSGIKLAAGVKYRVEVLDWSGKVLTSKESVGNGEGPDALVIDFEAEETKLTVAERNSIAQVKIYTDYENTAANTGEMEIHWLNIANYVGFRGVTTDKLTDYDGSNNINLNASKDTWNDNGSGLFTVTSDASPWEISYANKPVGDWSYVVQYVKSNGLLGNFSKLAGGLTIPAGVKVIVKVEGSNLGQYWDEERKSMSNEIALVGNETGSCQGFELDLSGHTVAQRNSIHSIIILIDYDNETVRSGSIKVDWMGMSEYKNQKVAPYEYNGTDDSFNINAENKFQTNAEGKYVVQNDASPWVIKYTDKGAWDYLFIPFTGITEDLNTVNIGLQVAKGAKIIIKIEGDKGAAELKEIDGKAIEGTGECQGYKLDFSGLTKEQKESLNKVIIFIDYENNEPHSGEVTIHWCGIEKAKVSAE